MSDDVVASRRLGRSPAPGMALNPIMPALAFGANEPWMAEGVCRTTDPEIFFPDKGIAAREARLICAECPVRTECLQYVIDRDEVGIWAGFTERERMRLNRRQHPFHNPARSMKRLNGHGVACKCVACRNVA